MTSAHDARTGSRNFIYLVISQLPTKSPKNFAYRASRLCFPTVNYQFYEGTLVINFY